jgi:hypothetical protein
LHAAIQPQSYRVDAVCVTLTPWAFSPTVTVTVEEKSNQIRTLPTQNFLDFFLAQISLLSIVFSR